MEFRRSKTELHPEFDPKNDHFIVSAASNMAVARSVRETATSADARQQIGPDGPAAFAAVIYPAKKGDRKELARFVESLKKSSVRVGGILQEKISLGSNGVRRVEAIDISTGRRTPINKPTPETWRNRVCSLDISALAETTAILRTATEDHVDLMVVEKFGDAERDGAGLIDEVLQGIAAGIPLLIAVPETNLPIWTERSGGTGAVLPCDEHALHKWWASLQIEYAASSAAVSD
jgi:nucleoside-triphosphatase THEP1